MENRLIFHVLLVATLLLGPGVRCQGSTEFLLVHGAFHGAWCWYKVATQLQQSGYKVTTLDLISDGRDKTSADTVTSLAQFTKPLTDYLASVSGQVVLVGHSLGGIEITYAMEQQPSKISKAIFLAAVMPLNNQSGVASAPPTALPNFFAENAATLNYANGPTNPPTSLSPNLAVLPSIFYNESPAQDITLALTLLDKEPYEPLVEVLSLTASRYGSVRRFFVKTDVDNVFPGSDLEYIVNQNPPEKVFTLSGSDHAAFFSKPGALVNLLVKISTL